jgi:hypothetical protein
MAKHIVKGWIAMSIPDHPGDKPSVTFMTYKPSGEYYVPVREHSIEVEIDDGFDLRPLAVEAIDKKISDTRAELTASITQLQERKAQLLCIEMAPS